jgi:branched-chain amino acid transport system ATP-binding protein
VTLEAPLLSVHSVSKRFGGVVALAGVSLQVDRGEVVGLIGPNGAGKTTLFEVISGHARPSAGKVLFKGVDVTDWPVYRRARAGIGRTFQRMELFSGLNFYEHVVLAMRSKSRLPNPLADVVLGGRPSLAEQRAARELRDLVGLSEREARRPVEALSLGHGRLVELARALATSPDLLLLDEPSSGLSTPERDAFVDTLSKALSARSLGAVIIEHDVGVVFSLARRVVVLSAGELVADGIPEEVRASERVRELYFGKAG